MPELSDFRVGQTVELSDGRIATVHYIGNPHFAPGEWVGVELEDSSGKNDGTVQGQRYFDCPQGHGMFVRPSVVSILDQPTPKPGGRPNGKVNGAATKERPQSLYTDSARRQSVKVGNVADRTAIKRQSINAESPTPATRRTSTTRLTVRIDG